MKKYWFFLLSLLAIGCKKANNGTTKPLQCQVMNQYDSSSYPPNTLVSNANFVYDSNNRISNIYFQYHGRYRNSIDTLNFKYLSNIIVITLSDSSSTSQTIIDTAILDNNNNLKEYHHTSSGNPYYYYYYTYDINGHLLRVIRTYAPNPLYAPDTFTYTWVNNNVTTVYVHNYKLEFYHFSNQQSTSADIIQMDQLVSGIYGETHIPYYKNANLPDSIDGSSVNYSYDSYGNIKEVIYDYRDVIYTYSCK